MMLHSSDKLAALSGAGYWGVIQHRRVPPSQVEYKALNLNRYRHSQRGHGRRRS
jgi:hypothetical protein